VGETGTIAATPAVVNAVLDAISHLGIEHIDIPLTPTRIWEAVEKTKSRRETR
jgi:carbon-monoxide dehydrogenase large subunit